jgi:NCAIR mutase (PurE)-related protein
MTDSPNSRGLADANDACLDVGRQARKGVPEIVFSSTKTVPQCLQIAEVFLRETGRAILSRVSPELERALREEYGDDGLLEWYPASRAAIIRHPGAHVTPTGGKVGVITAGTSDQPIAEEAAIVCREMGCAVETVYDVGVAGLHRLFSPLQRMLAGEVDVLIVAAGMDGALPSVVSGLVDVPVIGLPTSVGYGYGGRGEAALMSMLQTCSPGLAVVNIDNGVGAGAMAGLIANRAARARARGRAGE